MYALRIHKGMKMSFLPLLPQGPAPAKAGVNLSPRKRGAGIQNPFYKSLIYSTPTGFPFTRE